MISAWQMKVSRGWMSDTFLTVQSVKWCDAWQYTRAQGAHALICSHIKNQHLVTVGLGARWMLLAVISATTTGLDSSVAHTFSGKHMLCNFTMKKVQSEYWRSLRDSTTSTTYCSSSLTTLNHRVHTQPLFHNIMSVLSDLSSHNKYVRCEIGSMFYQISSLFSRVVIEKVLDLFQC